MKVNKCLKIYGAGVVLLLAAGSDLGWQARAEELIESGGGGQDDSGGVSQVDQETYNQLKPQQPAPPTQNQ